MEEIILPKISIIVPVYNVEKYLERCINSILDQTFMDYELILVNDGSTDNSGSICNSLKDKDVRIIVINKENGGLSSARNAGLEIARGEYIGFVDSDDWITSDMFGYLYSLINKFECDIASASYVFSKGNHRIAQPKLVERLFKREEALKYYLYTGMANRISDFSVCTKLYKRTLFSEIKFPVGQLYEDVATNFSLIQKSKLYVKSNKICYYYYQEGSSITRAGFRYKDFDMIKTGNDLITMSKMESNQEIIELARMKKARSYFSILSKISMYGFNDEVDNKKEIVKKITIELRSNYLLLIKSPMPINRKIIMSVLALNINLIRYPIKVVQFLIRLQRRIGG